MNNISSEDLKYPSLTSKKHPIPHVKVPACLLDFLIENPGKQLSCFTFDCLLSDPFGSDWRPLITSVSKKSRPKLRKILIKENFFSFKQETIDQKEKRWLVLNLNGAYRYKNFLKSEYWEKVRKLILERDSHKCCHCGSPKSLAVHHKTYENHRDELNHLEDLVTLCRSCHRKEHTGS